MRSAPHLFNEDARLAALAEYDLLSGTDNVDLDHVVQLAARMFDVPIALVSLVERDTQTFKARVGLDVCGTDRDISFCTHAIAQEDVFIVPDALLDMRFATNPLVIGRPGIRFYAGVPLRSPSGHALGSFCIIDRRPRNGLSARERTDLQALAAIVVDRLEMRRLAVASAVNQWRFENISATSPDGIICADQHGRITFWNAACEHLFGFSAEEAVGASIDIIVPERMRGGHGGGLHRVAAGGAPRLVGTTVELEAASRDGSEFPIELSLSMWREDGCASFGAIIRDIGERRANETRLFNLAHLDNLTDLPNRAVLLRRVAECDSTVEPFAILMVDLDGFKNVNDTLGHTAGDLVLRQVAKRLLECVRPIDTVARLGGDEFAILMPGCCSREVVAAEADCLIAAVGTPCVVDGQLVHVGASIGIAFGPNDGVHAEDLLSAADLAMYQAKGEGRNCHRFQFRTGNLSEDVGDVLRHTGLPAAGLELEITENIVLRHDDTMLKPLRALREMGVGIAFDDFGTGFASLSLLKRYPLTRLKIDRSFVRDICDDRADAAVVNALVYLASSIDVEVIAEGVETEAQSDLLRATGCRVAQGYLYGRPMPLAKLQDLITENHILAA